MADDQAYIGGVDFPYPLAWPNKNERVKIGSRTRTRNGDMVILFPKNTSQTYREARLLFEWVPRASIDILESYCGTGATYTADIEADGTTRTLMFPHDAVKKWEHEKFGDTAVHAQIESQLTDLYHGELNVIIVDD